MKEKLTFNTISYAMLRGGMLIAIATLAAAALYLLKWDKGDLDTYICGRLAETFVKLGPLMLGAAVAAALYFERQFQRGLAREDRMRDL